MKRNVIFCCAAAVLLPLSLNACMTTVMQKPMLVKEARIRAEADKNAPAAWKLPLGSGQIDDMTILSPGRLLMTIRKAASLTGGQHVMLVDMDTGKQLWRYDGKGHKGEFQRVLASPDTVLYRFDSEDGEELTLVALNAANGSERWTQTMDGGSVMFHPLLADGLVLVIGNLKDSITATALTLSSGHKGWERKFASATAGAGDRPLPLITPDGMWFFYDGVEKISTGNGNTIWRRGDLSAETGLSPRLVEDALYLMDTGRTLHRLAAASGKSQWRSTAPADTARVTNIYPLGDRIYLRGMNPDAPTAAKLLVSVRAGDGKPQWRYDSQEFIVSNLIEDDGKLFFATRSHLGAVDAVSGKPLFLTEITNSGRTFPVQIRLFGGKVAFIGELIIAAVDTKQGKTVYSHGFDPVDDFASLNNIESTIRNNTGGGRGSDNAFGDMATRAAANSARYQEQSNHYATIASRETGFKAQSAKIKADMNADFAKAEMNVSLISSSLALGQAMAEAQWNADLKAEVRRQEYLRRVITSLYPAMEQGEYVYRPMRDARSRTAQFAGVAVVHMPSGKIAETSLSAQHFIYGLWNLIDFDKGLVYHNGVGLDPADYTYDGQTGHFPTDYLNTFLIAQPIRIPR